MAIVKISRSKRRSAVYWEDIRDLMKPAPWPMSPEAVEARRLEAEKLLGRPFPKLPREDLCEKSIHDLTAGDEWAMLDKLHCGAAPHVERLSR
jgi:hypothetical protein